MANIKDVAREANVSVATVSRVMNNRGYLSDEIRSKVEEAMKKLNYQPNDLARSLHRQKSNILGLIVPSVSHPFFGEVARRFEYCAHQGGYRLMICNSLQNRDKEREYIDMLKRSQVDGILMGSHLLDTGDYEGLSLPIISLDRQLGGTIPYICCDNEQGGELAAEHLLSLGCKNLVHISGNLDVKMLSNRRTDAFLRVCREANAPCAAYELPDSSVTDFHEEDVIQRILEENPLADGVFATSDVTAATVVAQAHRLGRKVPGDLKVVGFDGNLISTLTYPKLTTLVQPLDSICGYAFELLERMIAGAPVPNKTVLPVTLIARGSTMEGEK